MHDTKRLLIERNGLKCMLCGRTVKYFRFYRYGQPLIDKLYYKAKNGGN